MNSGPSTNSNPVIEISRLTKSYGAIPALRGIDLQVQCSEVFGFLGPNGAGKTTAIRCLLDLIRPTSGTIRVLGIDPQRDPVAVRDKVGYLPGELNLDDNLTARQSLRLFDSLRGGNTDWNYALQLAERMKLELDRVIKNFSKGNKQKVGVVQAFMHRPELLLLDEPTSGLDPLMQQEVLRLVREANAGGATVFFSSHILNEVEAAADRVGIVRRGKIVEITRTSELASRSLRFVNVTFADKSGREQVAGMPGITVVRALNETAVRLQVECDMDGLIKALSTVNVIDLQIDRPSLEEIFLSYYRDDDYSAGEDAAKQ